MSSILDALSGQEAGCLLLTRETTKACPFIQPLFDEAGYFPGGLTVGSTKTTESAGAVTATVTGTTDIDDISFPVEASFSGRGSQMELALTLTLTLASLKAEGSALKADWQPTVTFRSNAGHRKLELDPVHGTLKIGDFKLSASLQLSVPRIAARLRPDPKHPESNSRLYMTMPGPQLMATLRPEDTLRPEQRKLSELTKGYALPEVGSELTLKEIRFSADPWRSDYSLALDVAGHWKLLPGCALTEVAALIEYSGDTMAARATLRATVELGGHPFSVEASYDAGVSGWEFQGRVVPGETLDIAAFVTALVGQFGAQGRCPEALHGATVNELVALFSTATKTVAVRAEVSLVLQGKALDMTLLIEIEGSRTTFRGAVTLGSLEFGLVFDDTDRGRTLIASYTDSMPREVSLGDILATVLDETKENEKRLIELCKKAIFSIKDALFVYARDDHSPAWLVAADVEAGVDFSGLPLVGSSFPPGQGARLLLQPLFTSGGMDPTPLRGLAPAGGLSLPATLPEKEGFSLAARVALGLEKIDFSLPVHMSDGKMVDAPAAAPGNSAPGVTSVDNVSWVEVRKSFGALALQRLGIRYDSVEVALDFLLDAHLSGAGLTLALEGFGAHVKLADPSKVTPTLDGMGLDFRSPGLEIGGSLRRQHVVEGKGEYDEYVGTAIVKAGQVSINALGSYRIIEGHPSLFVYAALDYPIGGPAFFFVTGLAAAFGYNRTFKLPPIDRLAGFPLLAGKTDVGSATDLHAVSDQLREYVPAELGAVFLGVGLTFTTFQTVKSSALLTASFGKEVRFDLIGRSTMMMPAGATREQAVAVVEMAWVASYRPAEGLLALQAQLSPGSYVFSEGCQVTGGFAFHSWFSGPHEGQFVLTAGGYHPAFDLAKHPHFPRVPRLGVTWKVSDALSIKGDAYYALTSSGAMAGGHLEMVWDQHPYRAWCKAGIDCLFEWKPLHYTGEAYVELGASYTFEFGGTRHITIEAGADLTVFGPPFSGRARVSLGLFSFDMAFGDGLPKPPPVHLFDDGYADHEGKRVGTGFRGLLPETEGLCSVSVAAGLSRVLEKPKRWVVNPKTLSLVVDCVIPATQVLLEGMPRDAHDETSDAPSRFGIPPMAVAHDEVTSEVTVTVTKIGEGGWKPEKHLQYRLRRKGFPAALWGEPKPRGAPAVPTAEKLIDALCGVEIIPLAVPAEGNPEDSKGIQGTKLYERHRPALSHGTYEIKVKQVLSARSAAGSHTEACCRKLVAESSLQFEVAAEESLPASCVHGVFPPQGSLGDHAHSLPQIILERSTLPWESSAGEEVKDRTADTPWLALLVFDGEKKAVPDTPGDGLPGPARITVQERELPSAHDVELLCHVRIVGGVQRAVVVANRPPSPDKLSSAHLVSLCDIKAGDGAEFRLLSLWSWSFSCSKDGTGFESLVTNLGKAPVARARVRLPRALPSGERAEAYYHGPLGPKSVAADGKSGAGGGSAEREDISQLAAMELGRLLALRDKSVSVGLLRLKRSLAQGARHESQRLAVEHLYPRTPPVAARVAGPRGRLLPAGLHALLTPELATWAEGLVRLEGVPFRYILPDETVLPKESILSFELDQQWITNLLVGALAVGGTWRLSTDADTASKRLVRVFDTGNGPVGPDQEPLGALPTVSGFVLRSQLVSGWPAMTVRADADHKPLDCRRLSKDILLALFPGPIKIIKFVLPPETLHYEGTGKGKPIPPDWLAHAKTSIDLGPHVSLSKHEEVERHV